MVLLNLGCIQKEKVAAQLSAVDWRSVEKIEIHRLPMTKSQGNGGSAIKHKTGILHGGQGWPNCSLDGRQRA